MGKQTGPSGATVVPLSSALTIAHRTKSIFVFPIHQGIRLYHSLEVGISFSRMVAIPRPCHSRIIPRRSPMATVCVRSAAPSFSNMCLMCTFTVSTVMKRLVPVEPAESSLSWPELGRKFLVPVRRLKSVDSACHRDLES